MEESPTGAPIQESGQDNDATLVARARRGDPDAFRELVDRHRHRAFGLALRILRSRADAEEVAQDAFVRAWQGLAGFRGESAFATWLHRIVARAALDRARTLESRRRREVELDAFEDRDVSDPAADVAPTPEARKLERLVGSLPAPQRAAVTLYYYEDRSVERVAESLGFPAGSVKTHLSRARATLRRLWTREEGESPR